MLEAGKTVQKKKNEHAMAVNKLQIQFLAI
jgi:hypothetical protein